MRIEEWEFGTVDWFDSNDVNILFSDITAVRKKNKDLTEIYSKNYVLFGPDAYSYEVYRKVLFLNVAGEPAMWKKAMIIKTPRGPVRVYWRKSVKDWYQKITIAGKVFTSKFDYRYGWPVFITTDHLVYVSNRGMRFWITDGIRSPWKRDCNVFEVANYHLPDNKKLIMFRGTLDDVKRGILGVPDAVSSHVIKLGGHPVEIVRTADNDVYVVERDKRGNPKVELL